MNAPATIRLVGADAVISRVGDRGPFLVHRLVVDYFEVGVLVDVDI